MNSLTLGYSPCPNDTFIFYAMTHKRVDTHGLSFREMLCDVETLNRMAFNSELDITKISYHAFGHLRDKYMLLRAGGALGRGCGPLIVSKEDYSMEELRGKKIAIPGRLTTAYLLLQLYDTSFSTKSSDLKKMSSNIVEMPFHKIIDAVASDEVDAGLIIHESRFTYADYGLREIIDLGNWWEDNTGLPIPLGGIIAKRSNGIELNKKINDIVKRSVEYAFNNRPEPRSYIKNHSQELSDDVINQHIDLYVNQFSVDLGSEGEKAVNELLSRAEKAGIIPTSDMSVFG